MQAGRSNGTAKKKFSEASWETIATIYIDVPCEKGEGLND